MSNFSTYINALKLAIESIPMTGSPLNCEVLSMKHGDPDKKLPLPLVLIGAKGMEQITERNFAAQIDFDLDMEAHVILPAASATDRHAIEYSLVLVNLINRNNFNLDFLNFAEDIKVSLGDFTNAQKGYESRVVEWKQPISIDLVEYDQAQPLDLVSAEHVLSGTDEPVLKDEVNLQTQP